MGQIQMNTQELIDTARTLVAGDKGLLAMDESNPTCNKRFAKLGIPQTEEARRGSTRWRPDMRQKFIVGNWKMYTSTVVASRLAKAVVDGVGTKECVSVAVCPPPGADVRLFDVESRRTLVSMHASTRGHKSLVFRPVLLTPDRFAGRPPTFGPLGADFQVSPILPVSHRAGNSETVAKICSTFPKSPGLTKW